LTIERDWHYYQKTHTEVAEGEIILDIGAAEGLFSLSVADKCDKIILIEPNKFFANALGKSFSKCINKVEIINAAIGNENTMISFNSDSINSRVSNKTQTDNKQIRLAKIDSLGIEKITYLKADIEGYEQEMLKGAEQTIKKNRPKMAITTYHDTNDFKEMIKLVLSYVPEYKYYYKGIGPSGGKPVMIHFWI
jgi:FkbM family methyltransferase